MAYLSELNDIDNEVDDGDDDFAAENRPREPPKELLFGGKGTSKGGSNALEMRKQEGPLHVPLHVQGPLLE